MHVFFLKVYGQVSSLGGAVFSKSGFESCFIIDLFEEIKLYWHCFKTNHENCAFVPPKLSSKISKEAVSMLWYNRGRHENRGFSTTMSLHRNLRLVSVLVCDYKMFFSDNRCFGRYILSFARSPKVFNRNLFFRKDNCYVATFLNLYILILSRPS